MSMNSTWAISSFAEVGLSSIELRGMLGPVSEPSQCMRKVRDWRRNQELLECVLEAMASRTLYEKIWEAHAVDEAPGRPSLIYIDRHFIPEGTSPQAFASLKAASRKVRRPDLTFAVMDHSVSTKDRSLPV